MNENLTQIIFILDRSGSMGHLTEDTIGGYNTFIEKQKIAEGEALLTTILFDDRYEVLHDSIDVKKVKPLTKTEYYARGNTALLDAMGTAITTVQGRIDNMIDNFKPSKVICVITTDGQENSSREYKKDQIKKMIEHQQKGHCWEFIFLGANFDAVETARDYGITWASTYTANSVGTSSVFEAMGSTVTNYRSSGTVTDNFKTEIK